jgi:hypothetical protein
MTNKELLQLQDTPDGRKVLGEYLAELTVPIKQLKSHTSRCPKCGTSNIDRLREEGAWERRCRGKDV